MKTAIVRWMYADAKPWQFWMPQSGAVGGAIGAILVYGIFALVIA